MDIGDSFHNATDTFFGFLPNLLGFLLILLVGFVVAKVVAGHRPQGPREGRPRPAPARVRRAQATSSACCPAPAPPTASPASSSG